MMEEQRMYANNVVSSAVAAIMIFSPRGLINPDDYPQLFDGDLPFNDSVIANTTTTKPACKSFQTLLFNSSLTEYFGPEKNCIDVGLVGIKPILSNRPGF